MKKNAHPLIRGAFILTLAGLISRIIGFFYKIFLASLIGAEGIGIYQMVFPLYILCTSLASAGIQTAISRFTAENLSTGRSQAARKLFRISLAMAIFLSVIMSSLLFLLSEPVSLYLLREKRCLPILRLMAIAIPFEVIHGCIAGYFLGQQKSSIPAWLQLLEQAVRVGATVLLYQILLQRQETPTPVLAAEGLLIAEFTVSLASLTVLAFSQPVSKNAPAAVSDPLLSRRQSIRCIVSVAFPITCNRLLLNVLQSVEAAMIPLRLQRYYETPSTALSIYGVFTGMALPLIMFPCAITGSFSMVLLPSISEAHALKNDKKIAATIRSSLLLCLFLGTLCTAAFLQFGPALGLLLYHEDQVGSYLVTLAWICPFLYLNTVTASILHGLGKTMEVFLHNLAGLTLRLLFTWFLVPVFGIRGCLWGLLLSQLVTALLSILTLKQTIDFNFPATQGLLYPAIVSLISTTFLHLLQKLLPILTQTDQWIPFVLSAGIWGCMVFLFSAPAVKKWQNPD